MIFLYLLYLLLIVGASASYTVVQDTSTPELVECRFFNIPVTKPAQVTWIRNGTTLVQVNNPMTLNDLTEEGSYACRVEGDNSDSESEENTIYRESCIHQSCTMHKTCILQNLVPLVVDLNTCTVIV